MFVHITEDDKGQPFEVFINLGKAGGSAMADAEAVGLGPNKVLHNWRRWRPATTARRSSARAPTAARSSSSPRGA